MNPKLEREIIPPMVTTSPPHTSLDKSKNVKTYTKTMIDDGCGSYATNWEKIYKIKKDLENLDKNFSTLSHFTVKVMCFTSNMLHLL